MLTVRRARLAGRTVAFWVSGVLEGEQEVLIRSGGAAIRFPEDGNVELVSSRIATMSRGLCRLVGHVLRLH